MKKLLKDKKTLYTKIVPVNHFVALREACKENKCWGMYISHSSSEDSADILHVELKKSAPYLSEHDLWVFGAERHLILLFKSKKDLDKCYTQTVGDEDSRTGKGWTSVFAIDCSPKGEMGSENT